ncbi:DDE_3 domain-containing protein [Trichonephila clavipes]|uniref:DDE_3 domain-containing protein n=1 Tax=Trichonephila clavipes TaxID=2585209 RepID=A0A8X6VSH9_TRICX|nr:DDE_3 domain-containing protein [Trichonephila clavipes]
MIWVGIMLDGLTLLRVFERGSVTGVRYRDEVTEPYVGLFRGACGPEFLLMDDNVHRALLVDGFLESEDIRRMHWPVRSPDLNPIKHVWNALGRKMKTRNPLWRAIQEIKTTFLDEWEQLPHTHTRTDKLPYFKCDITLRDLYNRKRGPYPLLTDFFCLFCNHCFTPSNSNECYA